MGHGSLENEENTRIIEHLEGCIMVDVAAGGWHSVAVSGRESLKSPVVYIPKKWFKSKSELHLPLPLSLFDGVDIGDVYTWGWNERGQLGQPSKIVREDFRKYQIERGVNEDSSVQSLANEQYVNLQTLPGLVEFPMEKYMEIVKVHCGSRHTAALSGTLLLYFIIYLDMLSH